MSLSAARVESLAYYPAEEAGELVGWSDITIDEKGVVFASVAYARVANEGARYHKSFAEDGTQLRQSKDIAGFERDVQLGFTAVAANGDLPNSSYVDTLRGPNLFNHFTSGEVPFASLLRNNPDNTKGTWSKGGTEILETIKSQLSENEANWLYNVIYYNLALVAHEEDILADPSMAEATAKELSAAEDHRRSLAEIQVKDLKMARDLTAFGSVPADKLPQTFVESRRRIAEIEEKLSQQRTQGSFNSHQYPVGFRPAGRSWPYMDPTVTDEGRAFGAELRDLRQQKVTTVAYELERELAELRHRLEQATRIAERAGLLAVKELAAAHNVNV